MPEDDVLERLREEARVKGVPFRKALNDVVRDGLDSRKARGKREPFQIKPLAIGLHLGADQIKLSDLDMEEDSERWG